MGARFEALDVLIFIVPSVLSCIFFTSLDFPLEQCDVVYMVILMTTFGLGGPGDNFFN